MPKATVNSEATRVDLKSCPGGFVTLKQLPFGQVLNRRDRAARYLQEVNPNADPNAVSKVQIDILNEASRLYDFAHCIVDHNLENDEGAKLDFSERMLPMTLQILDPKIGSEIEREIDKLNREDENDEGFTTRSDATSTETGEGSQNGEAFT